MYKIGQKLVCIQRGWQGVEDPNLFRGPRYNEVVTYNGDKPDDSSYIALQEYPGTPDDPDYYDRRGFVPAEGNSKTLANSFVEIEETIDFITPKIPTNAPCI